METPRIEKKCELCGGKGHDADHCNRNIHDSDIKVMINNPDDKHLNKIKEKINLNIIKEPKEENKD
jgi:hypothetical protein